SNLLPGSMLLDRLPQGESVLERRQREERLRTTLHCAGCPRNLLLELMFSRPSPRFRISVRTAVDLFHHGRCVILKDQTGALLPFDHPLLASRSPEFYQYCDLSTSNSRTTGSARSRSHVRVARRSRGRYR